MFEQLIQALDAQNLKQGESIGLKKLCAAAGLNVPMWAERLGSVSIKLMVEEELKGAGYVVQEGMRGSRRTWRLCRLH